MGPLEGVKVIEFGGIGPGPFAAMLLSDFGADVVRVRRKSYSDDMGTIDLVMGRGQRSIKLDFKEKGDIQSLLTLVRHADIVIEVFRPGVAERLGIGPEVCLKQNTKLVYGRMTGWGQTGTLSDTAGHDINYLAVSGILGMLGKHGEPPLVPSNIVGDFAGGGMLLVNGVLAALLYSRLTGNGQVVDAAIVDGAALLGLSTFAKYWKGLWSEVRGSNLLDGGAPFYGVYETKDKRYLAIGALEDRFYKSLIDTLGLDSTTLPDRKNKEKWLELREIFDDTFRQRTRDDWCELFSGVDACVAPVLQLHEVDKYRHNKDRNSFIDIDGCVVPAPAPRFSETALERTTEPMMEVESVDDIVTSWMK